MAIRGTRTDGHGYVPEAIRRGASAILVEADFRADGGVPVIRVDDTRRALAEIAASFYGEPGSRLLLVGITGTVGKTTILTMG